MDKKIKPVLSWGGYKWEAGWHKERVKESKYGGCILYTYMKMEQ
jgi:hypothetical protein